MNKNISYSLISPKTSKKIEKKITSIGISLLSSTEILDISHGEIISAETYNYKTMKPVTGGLYCERIFGGISNYECSCGEYIGKIYEGIICENCKVEVSHSNYRRERIGHIVLENPIFHTWYLTSNNYISRLLNITIKNLSKIIYYDLYIDLNYDFIALPILIDVNSYQQLSEEHKESFGTGASALNVLFKKINLTELYNELSKKAKQSSNRLLTIKKLIASNTKLENLIINILAVLPANLRPLALLSNGSLGSTDVTFFYRLILMRNKMLKTLKNMSAPDIILKHSKILLQKSIDALFDNESFSSPIKNKNRTLKSLSLLLKGKYGMLRLNLLGKRVDFSARTVITVNPNLKMNECGIPKKMALELFKPFLINYLLKNDLAINIKDALLKINVELPEVIQALKQIVKTRMVFINRAPTLHSNSIQTYDIVLVDNLSLQINPMICQGFNADFDGDQMAIYPSILPITTLEARLLCYSPYNIFSPATGKMIIEPTREILMGCFYVSANRKSNQKIKTEQIFYSYEELYACIENKIINPIDKVRFVYEGEIIEVIAGRILINELLDPEFRNYNLEWNKKNINSIFFEIYKKYGFEKVASLLDSLKSFGLKYITESATTFSLKDIDTYEDKSNLMAEIFNLNLELDNLLKQQAIIQLEKDYFSTILWYFQINKLTDLTFYDQDVSKDIFLSVKSGARGNFSQLRQIFVARGIIADTKGNILTSPITHSYKEGLTNIEFFISSFGARKGVVDRNINTQEGGKSTRIFVEAVNKFIITEYDCCTEDYTFVNPKTYNVYGRIISEDLPEFNISKDTLITFELNKQIIDSKLDNIKIRTVFNCISNNGICVKCYGIDLTRHELVNIGRPVGIIAAQSAGEPAIQMTMRTFHTGGIVENNKWLDNCIFAEEDCDIKFNKDHISFFKFDNKFKGQVIFKTTIEINEKKIVLPEGSLITFNDNTQIAKGELLALISAPIKLFLSPFKGKVLFNNNLISQNQLLTSAINVYINNDNQSIKIPKGSYLQVRSNQDIDKKDILAKHLENPLILSDIVSGLNELQNILEARKAKNEACVATNDGNIKIEYLIDDNLFSLKINSNGSIIDLGNYETVIVKDGQYVVKGQQLTPGTINYNNLLDILPEKDIKILILEKIKSIYKEFSISIDNKHIEILIKRMFEFGKVKKGISEENYDSQTIYEVNNLKAEKLDYSPMIVGLSKASMSSNSFISKASFQDTKRVLALSALMQDIDDLKNIKENLIVGNQLNCGTGLSFDKNENIFNDNDPNLVIEEYQKKNNLSLFLNKVNIYLFLQLVNKKLSEIEVDTLYYTNQVNWYEKLIYITIDDIIKQYKKSC